MQALKALVIGMGLLVVAGMIGLGYGLYLKASDPDFRLFSDASKEGSKKAEDKWKQWRDRPAPKPFGDVAIDLPKGCHIASMRPTRGARLFLHIGPEGACERIIVVDVKGGKVLGTISPKP